MDGWILMRICINDAFPSAIGLSPLFCYLDTQAGFHAILGALREDR